MDEYEIFSSLKALLGARDQINRPRNLILDVEPIELEATGDEPAVELSEVEREFQSRVSSIVFLFDQAQHEIEATLLWLPTQAEPATAPATAPEQPPGSNSGRGLFAQLASAARVFGISQEPTDLAWLLEAVDEYRAHSASEAGRKEWDALLDKLLAHALKPDEIAGDPEMRQRRVMELVRWFGRFADENANPAWLGCHAFELAYYVASSLLTDES